MNQFGAKLGHLGAMLGHLGAMLSQLGVMLGHLGAILGLCGAILGPSWAYVGPFWGAAGAMLGLNVSFCRRAKNTANYGATHRSAVGGGSRIAKATAFGRGLCRSTGPAGPIKGLCPLPPTPDPEVGSPRSIVPYRVRKKLFRMV